MEISVRSSDQRIIQYGRGIGALDGCAIETVDDALLGTLQEDGDKHLNPDGSITVTPIDTSAEDVARAAAEAEKQAAQQAQLAAAQALIDTSSTPTQADAMTAFMRTLGLPL